MLPPLASVSITATRLLVESLFGLFSHRAATNGDQRREQSANAKNAR